MSSSLTSSQKCTSLSNSRAYPRLSAMHPPLPFLQVHKIEVARKGPSPSLKVCCQPRARGVEDEAPTAPLVLERSSCLGLGVISGETGGSAEVGTEG